MVAFTPTAWLFNWQVHERLWAAVAVVLLITGQRLLCAFVIRRPECGVTGPDPRRCGRTASGAVLRYMTSVPLGSRIVCVPGADEGVRCGGRRLMRTAVATICVHCEPVEL